MALRSSKRISQPKDLPDPFEWDFRDIDDETELHFATLYEYARSSKFRPILENWFNSPMWGDPTVHDLRPHDQICRKYKINKSTRTIGDAIKLVYDSEDDVSSKANSIGMLFRDTPEAVQKSHLLSIAVRFPEFPKPWMKVRLVEGDQNLKARCFEWPRSTPALRDLYAYAQEGPLYSLYHEARPANLECVTFEIDWTGSRKEIRDAFASWLSTRHPAGPGKPNLGVELKWLSTFRLRQAGHSDASARIKVRTYRNVKSKTSTFDCFPDYNSLKKWGTAVRRARNLLGKEDLGDEISRGFGHLWFC